MPEQQQWPGLYTAYDPHDMPPGAAQVQDNFQSVDPGTLRVRGGVGKFAFDNATGATTDVLAMARYQSIHKQYAVFQTSDGKVTLGHAATGNPIETAVSATQPSCWCQTRKGKLIRVNGLNRGTYFNGASVWNLGFDAPLVPAVTPGGSGAFSGTYTCATRYIDFEGNYSSLSPVVAVDATGKANFAWVFAQSTETRNLGIQILRSTADEATTLYAIATIYETDTPSTSYTETVDDDTLVANYEAVSILNSDGTLNARRYEEPPQDMEVVVPFQDRYFYLVPSRCSLSDYTTLVTGWTTAIINRYLYREAHDAALITAVTGTGGTTALSLTENTAVTTGNLISTLITAGAYVSVPPLQRNKVYYSETDEPESVPTSQNVIIVQENISDQDYPTGMMAHGSVAYFLKERHVYRFSYNKQPVIDGSIHLAYSRGCVNQRCWILQEDVAYLMDGSGVWKMNDSGFESISDPIGNYWSDGTIDFSKKKWFFASYEANQGILRFHVCFSGDTSTRPKRALCYSLRTKAWWTESYPQELSGAILLEYSNRMRTLVGGEDGNVLMLDEGVVDFTAVATGTVTTTVVGASNTLTDANATFIAGNIGAPVVITTGTGKGQVRTISARTGTELTVSANWTTNPDSTSTYIVGGIKAQYKSGLVELPDKKALDKKDEEPKRAIILTFMPTTATEAVNLQKYFDHDTSPENQLIYDKVGPVTSKAGSDYLAVDTKLAASSLANAPGYAKVPFELRANSDILAHRWLAVGIEAYQGAEQIKVYDVDLE